MMNSWVPHCGADEEIGFTPVRRRVSSINTRQPHGDLEKEWTAARCNRLLRVLQSRVAILNKDLSRMQDLSRGRQTTASLKFGATRKADQDTDWTQARKKVKRTYSTRGGKGNNDAGSDQPMRKLQSSSETRPLFPGEVSVPTPILNRARGDIVTTNSSAVPHVEIDGPAFRPYKRMNCKDGRSDPRLSRTMRDIRRETPASRYAIYEGIYNGLEVLLKATSPEEPKQKRTGPKSLFSLCLRAVPRYIAQEEKFSEAFVEESQSKSAINSRDISTEVYDDLESFGSNGKGWKPFRTIVRSHGIQLLSSAILTGSLNTEFVGILIAMCIRTNATKDAEILLSSLLSIASLPWPKSVFTRFDDERATRPLSMLWKYVEVTGSVSFQHRQLCALIVDGHLPLGWLATKEMGPVWTRAIQILSTGSNDTGTLFFMDTVLPFLAQAGGSTCTGDRGAKGDTFMLDALKQTFSSLLTTFLSIVVLSGETAEHNIAQNCNSNTAEYRHFVILMRSCLVQWELSRTVNVQGTLLIITNLILRDIDHESSASECDLLDTLLDHLRYLGESSSLLPSNHGVVAFICSIARCCGRGAANSGFRYLKILHQALESYICERDSDVVNIIREIIADSALAFAQDVPDRKHLDYAEAMEARVHRLDTRHRVSLAPENSWDDSKIGFRWEEGISEWVTATPCTNTRRCEDLTKLRRAQHSECITPYRPAVQRKLAKPAHLLGVQGSSESIGTTNLGYEPTESSPAIESPSSGLDEESERGFANSASPENDPDDYNDSTDDLASQDAVELEPPNSFDDTRDELSSYPIAFDQSDDGGSVDELRSSSSQSDLSNVSSRESSPQREGSLVDESFTSVSSASSSRSNAFSSHRRYVDRVPRLSRRVLRRSLQWQLFEEESHDELSFISPSSESGPTLQGIINNAGPRTRRLRPRKLARRRQSLRISGGALLSDSDDELCV